MDILVLDYNARKCAQAHMDAHISKGLLEIAQVLSTVQRSLGKPVGYQAFNQENLWIKWVKESRRNYQWLLMLATELNYEYRYRFGYKTAHLSYKMIQTFPKPNLPDTPMTEFVQLVPHRFKHPDTYQAYRNMYQEKKTHLALWTKRGIPDWWQQREKSFDPCVV